MDDPVASLLVIDDEAFVRDSLTAYLEDSGYRVYGAPDGEQGLALFHKHRPDLVLLDLKMPNMDGISVLKAMGEGEHETPVIVISGAGVMADVVEALRYGASDYLFKPIADMAVLDHSIARCLAQGRLLQENRRYRRRLEEANRELKENLLLLQKDHQAGRHVQLLMLPPTPKQFAGFEFSHLIIPSLYLSGDFVDYFPVGREHVVFFIADVSGHGASSAFVTVLLKNLFARKRSDYLHRDDGAILSPAAMLEHANNELLATGIGKHATLCVGSLVPTTGELCFSVAGHVPAPILVDADGCRYLEERCPPVGLLADAQFSEQQMVLQPGSTLTLFSDGVLDIIPAAGLIAQEKALLEAMRPGWRTMDDIDRTLGLHATQEAPDDIAALLITRELS
ncbi:MAG TPA: SpoIIE family protein phosphatase [Spongiibacteraceae bacterium]|jgi:serine phosphatase RsbU (regulator of sigma subunit)|nr:SpoIIE family protein phosphatase [Spongiibacteraceae bacterium]HUH37352.1 SpoIIE family protein phosphatase [Spongiibacteraceae bacterium]